MEKQMYDEFENNPEITELTAELSKLSAEVNEASNKQIPSLKYDEAVDILKLKISTLEESYDIELMIQQKLMDENTRLQKYIKEEEHLITLIKKYLDKNKKSVTNLNESIADNRKELYYKFEILHRKIIILLKKFAKEYFPSPPTNDVENDLFLKQSHSKCRKSKKSLLAILSELIPELGREKNPERQTGILKIDDFVPQEYIDMLLGAGIIYINSNNPDETSLR